MPASRGAPRDAYDQTNQLARIQDALGRPSGIALGPDYTVAYGYDPLGRFASASSSVESVQSVVQYAYLSGFDLVSGWSNDLGLAVTRAFEPDRNLITEIANRWGGADISTFAYDNDPAGRRTRRVDSASITNDFAYNLRSELIDAVMGTNSFKYAYDPIGNREWTQMNANTNWYTVNVLNQYTNLVTKNQEQGTTNRTQFAYDPDGNLTNDGVFAYAWDGENRLIEVTPLTIDGESRKLVNDYDYRSRRIRKRIVEPLFPDCYGCSPFFGQTNETVGFLYDAWAMIRETRNETTNLYVYGLDISGTSQGAGTIGGLLTLTKNEGQKNKNSYAVAYDANGNVTDLVDTNGTLAAHYEYDPYGNETAASGPLAEDNPFRFSTKYWDVETGLLYYGYRYYSPGMGRWLNRDPIGERGFSSLVRESGELDPQNALTMHFILMYGFVNNNCLTTVDLLGLSSAPKGVVILPAPKTCDLSKGGVGNLVCDIFAWGIYCYDKSEFSSLYNQAYSTCMKEKQEWDNEGKHCSCPVNGEQPKDVHCCHIDVTGSSDPYSPNCTLEWLTAEGSFNACSKCSDVKSKVDSGPPPDELSINYFHRHYYKDM